LLKHWDSFLSHCIFNGNRIWSKTETLQEHDENRNHTKWGSMASRGPLLLPKVIPQACYVSMNPLANLRNVPMGVRGDEMPLSLNSVLKGCVWWRSTQHDSSNNTTHIFRWNDMGLESSRLCFRICCLNQIRLDLVEIRSWQVVIINHLLSMTHPSNRRHNTTSMYSKFKFIHEIHVSATVHPQAMQHLQPQDQLCWDVRVKDKNVIYKNTSRCSWETDDCLVLCVVTWQSCCQCLNVWEILNDLVECWCENSWLLG